MADDLTTRIADPKMRRAAESEASARWAEAFIDSTDVKIAEAKAAVSRMPALEASVAALTKAVERPQTLSATLAPAVAKGTNKPPEYGLISAAAGIAELKRFDRQTPIAQTIREAFPGDNQLLSRKAAAEHHVKSATGVAGTDDVLTGGQLTSTAVEAWVSALEAVSVYGAMAAGGTLLPMGDHNATTYPQRPDANLGDLAGAWVPEHGEIPVKSSMISSIPFNRYKMAVITVATKELIRTSTEDLLPLLQEMILNDTGSSIDVLLLDPSAGAIAGERPASPWNGATTQVSLGDAFQDLAWLAAQLTQDRGSRRPAIIMSASRHLRLWFARDDHGWIWRDDLAAGNILGIQLIVSSAVPEDLLFGIDLANFGFWSPPPMIDASQTATLSMSPDDDPTAPVKSMFQTFSVGLRMVQPITFGLLRADTTTCYLSGVTW